MLDDVVGREPPELRLGDVDDVTGQSGRTLGVIRAPVVPDAPDPLAAHHVPGDL